MKQKKYEIKMSMIVSCAMCGDTQTKYDKTINSLLLLLKDICAEDARRQDNNHFDARVIPHDIQYYYQFKISNSK